MVQLSRPADRLKRVWIKLVEQKRSKPTGTVPKKDTNTMSVDGLLAHGFASLGKWRTPECRVHRVDWIKRKPGLSAFVVDGQVCYIGMASTLHRRLRNYSNRCFRGVGTKSPRNCHNEIVNSVNAGRTVYVYAKVLESSAVLVEMETEMILEFRPSWNRTHGISREVGGAGLQQFEDFEISRERWLHEEMPAPSRNAGRRVSRHPCRAGFRRVGSAASPVALTVEVAILTPISPPNFPYLSCGANLATSECVSPA